MLIRRVEENTYVIGRALGNKKLKIDKEHPQFPWDEPDDGTTVIGDRADHTSEEVISFLDDLPGGGAIDG